MNEFRIVHKDHTGKQLGDAFPLDLEFTQSLKQIDSVTYKLNRFSPLSTKANTDPKRTDFSLRNGTFEIMAGEHTSVKGEMAGENLEIAGQGYLGYLDRDCFYPFDPANPSFYRYSRYQTDVATILDEILDTVLGFPNALPFTYTFAPTGILVNFRIELADTESIYNKIKGLSDQTPGFDFDVTPSRQIRLFVPKKGSAKPYRAEEGVNLISLGYENDGPDGNYILGLGTGTTSRLGKIKENTLSQTLHRRRMRIHDFGEVADANRLDQLTQAESDRASTDVVSLAATVQVDRNENLWAQVEPGDTIRVKGHIMQTYQEVDDDFRVVTMTTRTNNVGDAQVELGFNEDSVA